MDTISIKKCKNISRKQGLMFVFLAVLIVAIFQSCDYSKTEPTSSISTSTQPAPTSPSPSPTTSTTSPSFNLPAGTDLKFETIIDSGNIGGPYYKEKSAQVVVISSNQTLPTEALSWVHPEYRTRILVVDYTKYFVVMAFNGYRIGIFSDFKIQKIRQDFRTVYLIAHFNDFIPDATSLPSTSSQYQVVKINRTQIMQTGTITFKLLDETGKERARATYEFSK